MELSLRNGGDQLKNRSHIAVEEGRRTDGSVLEDSPSSPTAAKQDPQQSPSDPIWKRCFGLDYRSLAAARILTGMVVIYEVRALDYWNMRAFFTDAGVWPRPSVIAFTHERQFQLHLVLGSVGWAATLHIILFCCGVLIILGWKTRYACAGAWVIWMSIQNRCWPILHSFDHQLSCHLLWGALGLPWSKRWSMDNILENHGKLDNAILPSVLNFQTLCMCFHTANMYCMAAFHKGFFKHVPGAEVWQDGSVIFLTHGIHALTRPIGSFLMMYGFICELMRLASKLVLYVEVLGPVAFLSPWKYAKMGGVFSLACMHLGIGVLVRLNDIPFINSCALLAMLPAEFWDIVLGAWFRFLPYSIAMSPQWAFQDFVGFLCRWGIAVPEALSMAKSPRQHLPATDADKTAHPARARLLSWLDAIWAWATIGMSGWCCMFLIWNTAQQVCGGPAQEPCLYRWWTIPPSWNDFGLGKLNLGGNWKVFSPRPLTNDFWTVFPGKLQNNQSVDVLRAGFGDFRLRPVDFLEPDIWTEPFSYVLRDERWYKFFEYMFISGDDQRKHEMKFMLGRFICREWNERYGRTDKRLTTFKMLHFSEFISVPPLPIVREKLKRVDVGTGWDVWTQVC